MVALFQKKLQAYLDFLDAGRRSPVSLLGQTEVLAYVSQLPSPLLNSLHAYRAALVARGVTMTIFLSPDCTLVGEQELRRKVAGDNAVRVVRVKDGGREEDLCHLGNRCLLTLSRGPDEKKRPYSDAGAIEDADLVRTSRFLMSLRDPSLDPTDPRFMQDTIAKLAMLAGCMAKHLGEYPVMRQHWARESGTIVGVCNALVKEATAGVEEFEWLQARRPAHRPGPLQPRAKASEQG